MDHDLLDNLLDLEERFYKEGYELGATDGIRSGYSEGSVFAVEKGFEKFQEIGRIYGKAIVWTKRLPGNHGLLLQPPATSSATSPPPNTISRIFSFSGEAQGSGQENKEVDIPDSGITNARISQLPSLAPLPRNSRLEKHIASLLSLVDPLSLSLENSEDAVEDFDNRLKKAVVKVKLIERILGEQDAFDGSSVDNKNSREGNRPADGDNIEDFGTLPARMQQIAAPFSLCLKGKAVSRGGTSVNKIGSDASENWLLHAYVGIGLKNGAKGKILAQTCTRAWELYPKLLTAIANAPSLVACPPIKPVACTKTAPGGTTTLVSSLANNLSRSPSLIPHHASGNGLLDSKLVSVTGTHCTRHLASGAVDSGYSTEPRSTRNAQFAQEGVANELTSVLEQRVFVLRSRGGGYVRVVRREGGVLGDDGFAKVEVDKAGGGELCGMLGERGCECSLVVVVAVAGGVVFAADVDDGVAGGEEGWVAGADEGGGGVCG
ncbi:hypothetical protein HCAG_01989 [Histoplasma mississippiense (nom. inval.)]|uniref:hypothetical protein n=1 Tax=Ajellomyces capsulatus (strain NAm1 / WU24) TaxID=2059318 RepID=UPI000157BAC3|nr:hypothetical protein HCAG_01989 [Histoplasma mississippiense (nom. inval.)]EDN04124.1 hypothetical protein HCAG_01989 [Histoplasma mississippiense (nom. inval.)]